MSENKQPEVKTPEVKTPDTKAPETKAPEAKADTGFTNKIPANWIITPTEDGIEAINLISKETFTGSMKEFNAKLRG